MAMKMMLLVILGVSSLCMTSEALFVPGQQRLTIPPECEEGKLMVHPDYCTKFLQCVDGKPIERDCPERTVFTNTFNICVHAGSELDTCTPAHPDRECKRKTVDVIPHATRCQGYYNCSDYVPFSLAFVHWSRGYEKECVFPQLYDIRRRECVSYENVYCGDGRTEAKWRCEYYGNMCWVAHCRPCWVDYPSCVRKPDGMWPVDYALWSPLYIQCRDERDFKGRLMCPDKDIFNPDSRICAPRTMVGPFGFGVADSGIVENIMRMSVMDHGGK